METMGGCIVCPGILLLWLAYSSLYFFIFQFLLKKITLSSETMRCTKLKLGTHEDNGWIYNVFWNLRAAAYMCPFIASLANFQTLKFLSHFSLELLSIGG